MSRKRFIKVWELFCDYYQMTRNDYEYYDKRSKFHGPHFREERDVVFHLARFCYKVFGDAWVHLDSPVYKMYFDKLNSTKRYVDIDISDPDSFMTKNAQRGIFVEVKWIWQGMYKARASWLKEILDGIEKDLQKLKQFCDMGCCEHSFMCIVDEEPEHTKIEMQNKVTHWKRKYSPVKVLIYSYYIKS